MKRHVRDNYYVVGEGILTSGDKGEPVVARPSTTAELRKFRFSRIGPKGTAASDDLRKALANAMTPASPPPQPDSESPKIPAGFTYLGQFVDHDLTKDVTDVHLGEDVSVEELVQGRSPALDLDSLYGRGPGVDTQFYSDAVHLKTGTTTADPAFPGTNVVMDGFDLPRVGIGSKLSERRAPQIPDGRNDENLAVAQTHLAFIRFHNKAVDTLAETTPTVMLFPTARDSVVKHYQWMLRHDYLTRIVDDTIVDDVFANGRQIFEVPGPNGSSHYVNPYMHIQPGDKPTMPIEFSVAAFRLGHSMIRGAYNWNRVFKAGSGLGPIASLALLFRFSGTSGVLDITGDMANPDSGVNETLPTSWIADFRRLYDFTEAGRADLVPPDGRTNETKLIDTLLVDPLRDLPLGSFGGRGTTPPPEELNLAFRNLVRAGMVELATGQQMADLIGVTPLTEEQIVGGPGKGADLTGLSPELRAELVADTPLWFYILREAEVNGGRLTGVGGRIVAEVFHRAMECSRSSIVRDPGWRPTFGPDADTFRMSDLLLFAFEGRADLLNPLGD